MFFVIGTCTLISTDRHHQNITNFRIIVIAQRLLLGLHFRGCLNSLDSIFNGDFNMMTSSNGNIFRVTGHLCQWCGALMFSLICVWINGWVNNREAGDLRRYRVHYDVTVMKSTNFCSHMELTSWHRLTMAIILVALISVLLCFQP